MSDSSYGGLVDILDENIRTGLRALGETPTDVANTLTRAGITGVYLTTNNPVAEWLRRVLSTDVEVGVDGASASYYDGRHMISAGITTPPAVAEFLHRWDAGEYAHLKSTGLRTDRELTGETS